MYPGDASQVTSLPVFIQNIFNFIPKTNYAFASLERHEVSEKWQSYHFGVEYLFKVHRSSF